MYRRVNGTWCPIIHVHSFIIRDFQHYTFWGHRRSVLAVSLKWLCKKHRLAFKEYFLFFYLFVFEKDAEMMPMQYWRQPVVKN